MRRRGAGALLVTLAVLAAVVVPHIASRSVRGLPRAAEIPGPPGVGDCLLSPVSLMAGGVGTTDATAGPAVGPCTGSRFGEIVLVHDTASLASFPDGERLAYPQDGSCWSATQAYLGLPDLSADPVPVFTYWLPAGGGGSMELAPTALQRAAGRTWTACVVLTTDEHARTISYPSTVRDAFTSGAPPAAFASCTDTADITEFRTVPCDEPHHLEVLGYSGDLQGATGPSLARTCADLAARQTRMPDPTAGGVLQIRAALGHYDVDGTLRPGLREDPGGFADIALCRVIAPDDRPLTGTLLGLGDRPVPWA